MTTPPPFLVALPVNVQRRLLDVHLRETGHEPATEAEWCCVYSDWHHAEHGRLPTQEQLIAALGIVMEA